MVVAKSWRSAAMDVRAVVLVAGVVLTLVGCSSASTPSAPATAPRTASAISQWHKAYAFLASQKKSAQILCSWFDGTSGEPVPLARPTVFYDFSQTSSYKHGIVTRDDPLPRHTFELCEAIVPTSVPYGPAIETFLRPLGLTFVAHPLKESGLIRIEIAYAGQNASDPDIIYRHTPGLFALRMALNQLGEAPFAPGTSRLLQPTNDAAAARYLRYAQPLLRWYGYRG